MSAHTDPKTVFPEFACRVGSIITIVLAALLFIPWLPLLGTGYAEHRVHIIFAEHYLHGLQALSTYGPLGFLGVPFYHPKTYAILIAYHVFLFAFTQLCYRQYWKTFCKGSCRDLWIFGLFAL